MIRRAADHPESKFSRALPRAHRRRAFTTAELLVSLAVLSLAVVTIAGIFHISSTATSRTAAHADLVSASDMFRQQISDELSKIEPGLLIIDSPTPTAARSDIPNAPDRFRLRHDRIVFIASGDRQEFQSFTDPTHGTPANPDWNPSSSPDALVYWGPGLPVEATQQIKQFDNEVVALAASEWMFMHRALLLMLEKGATTDTAWTPADMTRFTAPGGMLHGGNLFASFVEGRMDTVVSSATDRASASTLVNLIQQKPLNTIVSSTPDIDSLWQPSWAPVSFSLSNPLLRDYYGKHGFVFRRGMCDFRIEWTDGRVLDPLGPDGNPLTGDEDLRTRWFGLRPDPSQNVNAADIADPSGITYFPDRRQDIITGTTQAERDLFATRIEWSSPGNGASSADAAYRAIWRMDTWQYRPKALRFTYRIYDIHNRLDQSIELDLDEDGDPDPDGAGSPALATRFGQEFSIIVPVP